MTGKRSVLTERTEAETLPCGGGTFWSSGATVGFGALGVGFFSTVGSLNKSMHDIDTVKK